MITFKQHVQHIREGFLANMTLAAALTLAGTANAALLDNKVAIPFNNKSVITQLNPIMHGMKNSDLKRYKPVVDAVRNADPLMKLNVVNKAVNTQLKYHFTGKNSWNSVDVLVDKPAGDCKDYVVLKMAMLVQAGINQKDLSILVVKDEKRNIQHAVLLAQVNGKTYVLDSARPTIADQSSVTGYTPLFKVDTNGMSVFGVRKAGT